MDYTQHKDFKGIWFPAEIMCDRKISVSAEKLYVILLQKFAFEKETTLAISNHSLSEYCLMPTSDISKALISLQQNNYIKLSKMFASDKEVFDSLNGNFSRGCLFCGYDEIGLDKHHYPIRAKAGGTDIINICPNCHRLFHLLADHKKIITIINKKHIEDFLEVWRTK